MDKIKILWPIATLMILAITSILLHLAAKQQKKHFWLRFLLAHGPTLYEEIPQFRSSCLPLEQYLRAGYIEIDRVNGQILVQASGYARACRGTPE